MLLLCSLISNQEKERGRICCHHVLQWIMFPFLPIFCACTWTHDVYNELVIDSDRDSRQAQFTSFKSGIWFDCYYYLHQKIWFSWLSKYLFVKDFILRYLFYQIFYIISQNLWFVKNNKDVAHSLLFFISFWISIKFLSVVW